MRSASFQIVLATALLGLTAGAAPVPPEAEKPLFSEEDAKTLSAYRLDVPKLDRFETVLREMDLKSQTDEALKEELDHDEAKTGGIDRFVEAIEKEKPKMVAILLAAGLPPRDFVLTSYSVMMAMVHADLLKAEAEAAVPSYVPRENLGFVKRYEDRLTKLFEALNRE